jgi:alkanesulfonate monooxygenase SsuD/methylene tetrahydromethanopterin reductase-like flavin-dependent oxidoreductase (luciferase family)
VKDRASRLDEGAALLHRLWTEEHVSHRGRHFPVQDVTIGPRPVQQPRPPVWFAGWVEAAIRRAARLGDAWLITNFAHLSVLEPQMKMYCETLAEFGKPLPTEIPITRECHIGPTHAKALEECQAALEYKYKAYSSWGLDRQSENAESFDQPFEQFVQDRFIIGDKVYVAEEIQRYRSLLGVNHFIMRVQWPGLENSKAFRTISTLGEIFA